MSVAAVTIAAWCGCTGALYTWAGASGRAIPQGQRLLGGLAWLVMVCGCLYRFFADGPS